MGRRISTYGIDRVVAGNDKWIGTDTSNGNATMNFTPDGLALYYIMNGYVDPSRNGILYTYQNPNTDNKGVLSTTVGAQNVPLPEIVMADLTELIVSKSDNNRTDQSQLLTFMDGSSIKVTVASSKGGNLSDPGSVTYNYGLFSVVTSEVDDNYYRLALSPLVVVDEDGNDLQAANAGSIRQGDVVSISLISAGSGSEGGFPIQAVAGDGSRVLITSANTATNPLATSAFVETSSDNYRYALHSGQVEEFIEAGINIQPQGDVSNASFFRGSMFRIYSVGIEGGNETLTITDATDASDEIINGVFILSGLTAAEKDLLGASDARHFVHRNDTPYNIVTKVSAFQTTTGLEGGTALAADELRLQALNLINDDGFETFNVDAPSNISIPGFAYPAGARPTTDTTFQLAKLEDVARIAQLGDPNTGRHIILGTTAAMGANIFVGDVVVDATNDITYRWMDTTTHVVLNAEGTAPQIANQAFNTSDQWLIYDGTSVQAGFDIEVVGGDGSTYDVTTHAQTETNPLTTKDYVRGVVDGVTLIDTLDVVPTSTVHDVTYPVNSIFIDTNTHTATVTLTTAAGATQENFGGNIRVYLDADDPKVYMNVFDDGFNSTTGVVTGHVLDYTEQWAIDNGTETSTGVYGIASSVSGSVHADSQIVSGAVYVNTSGESTIGQLPQADVVGLETSLDGKVDYPTGGNPAAASVVVVGTDGVSTYRATSTLGGTITIQNEGTSLATAASTINFTGDNITATGTGAVKTINVDLSEYLDGGELDFSNLTVHANTFDFDVDNTGGEHLFTVPNTDNDHDVIVGEVIFIWENADLTNYYIGRVSSVVDGKRFRVNVIKVAHTHSDFTAGTARAGRFGAYMQAFVEEYSTGGENISITNGTAVSGQYISGATEVDGAITFTRAALPTSSGGGTFTYTYEAVGGDITLVTVSEAAIEGTATANEPANATIIATQTALINEAAQGDTVIFPDEDSPRGVVLGDQTLSSAGLVVVGGTGFPITTGDRIWLIKTSDAEIETQQFNQNPDVPIPVSGADDPLVRATVNGSIGERVISLNDDGDQWIVRKMGDSSRYNLNTANIEDADANGLNRVVQISNIRAYFARLTQPSDSSTEVVGPGQIITDGTDTYQNITSSNINVTSATDLSASASFIQIDGSGGEGTNVVANPSSTTGTLSSITIGDTSYALSSGTVVAANPAGTDGDDLTRITIGTTNYNLAGGAGELNELSDVHWVADADRTLTAASATDAAIWQNTGNSRRLALTLTSTAGLHAEQTVTFSIPNGNELGTVPIALVDEQDVVFVFNTTDHAAIINRIDNDTAIPKGNAVFGTSEFISGANWNAGITLEYDKPTAATGDLGQVDADGNLANTPRISVLSPISPSEPATKEYVDNREVILPLEPTFTHATVATDSHADVAFATSGLHAAFTSNSPNSMKYPFAVTQNSFIMQATGDRSINQGDGEANEHFKVGTVWRFAFGDGTSATEQLVYHWAVSEVNHDSGLPWTDVTFHPSAAELAILKGDTASAISGPEKTDDDGAAFYNYHYYSHYVASDPNNHSTRTTGKVVRVSYDGDLLVDFLATDNNIEFNGDVLFDSIPDGLGIPQTPAVGNGSYYRSVVDGVVTWVPFTPGTAVDSVNAAGAVAAVEAAATIDLGGTLDVTGAATLDSTLSVATNATVGGTLGVTGTSTLGVTNTGNTSVGGTLGVTGTTTLAGTSATTFTASGDTTLNGRLNNVAMNYLQYTSVIVGLPSADATISVTDFDNGALSYTDGVNTFIRMFRTDGTGEQLRLNSATGTLLYEKTY